SVFFFFSSRRRHTRFSRDWSSDVCSSDVSGAGPDAAEAPLERGRHTNKRRPLVPDQLPITNHPSSRENVPNRPSSHECVLLPGSTDTVRSAGGRIVGSGTNCERATTRSE